MARIAGTGSGKGAARGGGKGVSSAASALGKSPTRKDAALGKLRAELAELASDLEAEGLEFLIEQARVLRYNREVETLERLGDELEAARERSGARGGSARSRGGAAKTAAAAPRFVAGEDGKTFHLVWKGEYKLFGGDEVRAMLKAARGGSARLWAWLEKERADAIGDLALSGPSDPDLARLVSTLEATFVIRKP